MTDRMGWLGFLMVAILALALLATGAHAARDVADWPRLAPIGDFWGGLANILAMGGVVITLFMQKQELGLQRQELQLTRGELEGQREELARQASHLKDQVGLIQRQLELSVRPLLEVFVGTKDSSLTVRLHNMGMGPARIKTFRASRNDKTFPTLVAHIHQSPGKPVDLNVAGLVSLDEKVIGKEAELVLASAAVLQAIRPGGGDPLGGVRDYLAIVELVIEYEDCLGNAMPGLRRTLNELSFRV